MERIEVTMNDPRYNYAFVHNLQNNKSSAKSPSVLSSHSSVDVNDETPEFNVDFKLGCSGVDNKPTVQALSATLTARELLPPSPDGTIVGEGISPSDSTRDGLLGSVSTSGDGE